MSHYAAYLAVDPALKKPRYYNSTHRVYVSVADRFDILDSNLQCIVLAYQVDNNVLLASARNIFNVFYITKDDWDWQPVALFANPSQCTLFALTYPELICEDPSLQNVLDRGDFIHKYTVDQP